MPPTRTSFSGHNDCKRSTFADCPNRRGVWCKIQRFGALLRSNGKVWADPMQSAILAINWRIAIREQPYKTGPLCTQFMRLLELSGSSGVSYIRYKESRMIASLIWHYTSLPMTTSQAWLAERSLLIAHNGASHSSDLIAATPDCLSTVQIGRHLNQRLNSDDSSQTLHDKTPPLQSRHTIANL
jgi:hypothetical protein